MYASQMVTNVDKTIRTQAIWPICLALGSADLAYFVPGHLVTKMKQMSGRMMLKAYMPICVETDVESGAVSTLVPQFGQKYHPGKSGWWQKLHTFTTTFKAGLGEYEVGATQEGGSRHHGQPNPNP